ncbi:hypothetical protein D3OALGA1CA_5339 [Olavius algarvensis associated proteobacterium Delta 3]|nr:hypothetical protein D3OALGA1CA_5339 [Olavius algarvensis associated proteobacterium Delta 3]
MLSPMKKFKKPLLVVGLILLTVAVYWQVSESALSIMTTTNTFMKTYG